MDIWLSFIAGIIIGMMTAAVRGKANICGWLKIRKAEDEEAPYLFLELSKDVEDICRRRYVIFMVHHTHK